MLLLASGSPYRRELLARLQVPFEVLSPDIDESPAPGEAPSALASRLAHAKALAARHRWQERAGVADSRVPIVIGSDQVATLDGVRPIGKPGTHERAREQLRAASGRTLSFHTALCVLSASGAIHAGVVDTRVRFRELAEHTIETYLSIERPYDCAGAAKSEGLGICLIESIEGPDPTALIGLPLILLTTLLRDCGLPIPAP